MEEYQYYFNIFYRNKINSLEDSNAKMFQVSGEAA